jgi:CheY-like chemotaxis protein
MQVGWREESGGIFVAYLANLRLKVHRPYDDRGARFTVLKESGAGMRALIGSGSSSNVGGAMHAAEAMAGRIASLPDDDPLVMVVDDEDSVRESVAEALRDDGYRVVEATTAEGALRRLERTSRRVLLVSDVNLGSGMSGVELAATARGLWPAIGVLLMGAERPEAAKASDGEFLEKPFSLQKLLKAVAAAKLMLIGSQS